MDFSLHLGNYYFDNFTVFRVFATNADAVYIRVFEDQNSFRYNIFRTYKTSTIDVYETRVYGNLKNKAYDIVVERGEQRSACVDPYALNSTINSKRSIVTDLNGLKKKFIKDDFIKIPRQSSIIYETHIRDMTMHSTNPCKHKGKLLGVIENTENPNFGLGYIKEMGYTHVHYLPLQDFSSVDELDSKAYNWGYDPEHYFVIEGSYVVDPLNRILEFQEFVATHHKMGLGVIMDCVYNHVHKATENALYVLAKEVYFRFLENGYFSNGSGCGNELKTEHPMTRHLILNSLLYFAQVFKVDGFRFDLMALIDRETILEAQKMLSNINPDCVLYGEPWTGGDSVLPCEKRTDKMRGYEIKVSLFDDEYRNALKGSNDYPDPGFIQGNEHFTHEVLSSMLLHEAFVRDSVEAIHYMTSHDNLILQDKLKISIDEERIIPATKLGFSLILLSFGIPFVGSGTDFCRSKNGNHNTYNAGDEINAIDWSLVQTHKDLVTFVKGLIEVRKELTFFADFSLEDIRKYASIDIQNGLIHMNVDSKTCNCRYVIFINTTNSTRTHKQASDYYVLFKDGYIPKSKRKLQKPSIIRLSPYQVKVIRTIKNQLTTLNQ